MAQVEVISDAQLINTYAQKIMEEPEVEITTQAPPEPVVDLYVGFMRGDDHVKTAEIRELTGEDEELISKSGSIGKALEVILKRGTVLLGDQPPSESELSSLISGDRDNILLSIRRATFGNDVDVALTCSACGNRDMYVIDLVNDVPVVNDGNPIMWDVKTRAGIITVAMPTGNTQKKVIENNDKTSAELSTIFLSGCIVQVDREPVVGSRVALSLGISDRELLLKEILTKTPGPRLMEVSKTCKACEDEIFVPLSLADLFRL